MTTTPRTTPPRTAARWTNLRSTGLRLSAVRDLALILLSAVATRNGNYASPAELSGGSVFGDGDRLLPRCHTINELSTPIRKMPVGD